MEYMKLDIQLFAEGKIVIETEVDNSGLESGLKKAGALAEREEKRIQEIKKRTTESEELKREAQEQTAAAQREAQKYEEQIAKYKEETLHYTEEIARIEQENITQESIQGIQSGINSIGQSIKNITNKVVAWGLAVFGIRSAYNAIRNAMSTIISQDSQLSADIEYMKNAIAYTLEPVVRAIVNLMKQLMFYVAYIIKAWTGKNIFENANKSLQGANKQAKQLNKTLAGFDEMNVLSDTSGGDAGGGGVSPSFDFGDMGDMEVPEWLKWIAENKDIVIAGLLGIAAALLVVQLGLTGLFGGLIVGLIVALVALIIQNWDTIKEVLGKVWSWIDEHIIQPVVSLFVWLWDKIVEIFGPIVSFFFNIYSKIFEGIMNIIKTIWTNISTIISNVIQIVSVLWNTIISILKPIATWIWNNVLSPVVNFFKGIIDTIWGLIKTIATTVGNVLGGAFKAVINGVLGAIESILNFPIKSINKLIDVINKVPGINLGKLTTFSLPRLAKGGIVNMPSRGVPVGGAIAGERGAEGVIPLTDSQQMALLGEAIGKYITINANITNTMNGRIISRELQRVQNDSDFAFNR